MENHIYRLELLGANEHKPDLELYVYGTNDVNPYRKIKELGIVIFDKQGLQLDACLDESELDSIIKYLNDARTYINDFNKNSKP